MRTPALGGPLAQALSIGARAVAILGPVIGWTSAGADPNQVCAGASHRFETFALFAPALERAKQILVYLPPGYDCAPRRRYPFFYFNDGHDLFDWNPSAAGLEPALARKSRRARHGTAAGISMLSSMKRLRNAACRR